MNLDERTARKFLALQKSAEKRDLDFDLTLTGVKNLLKAKRCRYTGAELTFELGEPNQFSVDRVDNSKGYVTGNVVACSREFNEKKGSLTKKDIKLILKVLDKS